jgi:hypothetical protein
MPNLDRWLARKAREDRRLYEVYGKALMEAHQGEYVAIGFDGQVILGKRAGEVLQQAVANFGSGKFALTWGGDPTLRRWLNLNI